jgi:hypothetical protein
LSAFKIVDFNIKAMGATEQSKEGRNSKASLKSLIRKVKSYRETLSSLILKTAFFLIILLFLPCFAVNFFAFKRQRVLKS